MDQAEAEQPGLPGLDGARGSAIATDPRYDISKSAAFVSLLSHCLFSVQMSEEVANSCSRKLALGQ